MLIDRFEGPGRGFFSFVGQVEAESLEVALLKFAKERKFRMTHMRIRPGHRIGFRAGHGWFLTVVDHKEDHEFMRKQRGDRDYSHW